MTARRNKQKTTPEKTLNSISIHYSEVRRQLPAGMHDQLREAFIHWLRTDNAITWQAFASKPQVDPAVNFWMQHLTQIILSKRAEQTLEHYNMATAQIADWLARRPK